MNDGFYDCLRCNSRLLEGEQEYCDQCKHTNYQDAMAESLDKLSHNTVLKNGPIKTIYVPKELLKPIDEFDKDNL